MLTHNRDILDGQIDQIENQVNTIIINKKILPRYPFFVLSILETYEEFMPKNLPISSYGHCYYILILSYLAKSGISRSDDEINACLNFLENMAFKIYLSDSQERCMGSKTLKAFIVEYKMDYIIKDSTLNRMSGKDYGVITGDGGFKNPYMYYFFLGMFLARNAGEHSQVIQNMLDRNHVTSNFLTILFVIHHTTDEKIIEEILLRTMEALDQIKPATLGPEQVSVFEDIVADIPKDIISDDTVEAEREKERKLRDRQEELSGSQDIADGKDEPNGRVNENLSNHEKQ